MTNNESSIPWFKNGWVWFIISIPLASVFLSSIMIYNAVTGQDSIVTDNYYKEGRGINQRMELDKNADDLNIRPSLSLSEDGFGRISFNQPLTKALSFLDVKLIHPTLKSKDANIRMLPDAQGFSGTFPPQLSGRWYIDIYDPERTWRIRDEIILPGQSILLNKE